jgi:hypothetical protein
MAVKAVEMARKIRDKHYEQTRGLSPEEQIKFFRKKSRALQQTLKNDGASGSLCRGAKDKQRPSAKTG